jgi:hypothetical protein
MNAFGRLPNCSQSAALWDTHYFTDFAVAREKGIGPSTLARMWLKERLRQEARARFRSCRLSFSPFLSP